MNLISNESFKLFIEMPFYLTIVTESNTKTRGKTTSISQGRRTIKAFFYFLIYL